MNRSTCVSVCVYIEYMGGYMAILCVCSKVARIPSVPKWLLMFHNNMNRSTCVSVCVYIECTGGYMAILCVCSKVARLPSVPMWLKII